MKYKDVIFEGATFPGEPVKRNARIVFNDEILKIYIPTINDITAPKGIKLLAIIMTDHEGFNRGSRSFKTNNPGNIGNVDSGKNKKINSLTEGIQYQINELIRIAEGKHSAYPLGKKIFLRPYYSEEIAKNQKTYRMEPYLPGYKFIYDGSLEQFIKIYSTGARARNGYLSAIISFFANHGIEVNSKTTLKEILKVK
jgi:hypothetical protein